MFQYPTSNECLTLCMKGINIYYTLFWQGLQHSKYLNDLKVMLSTINLQETCQYVFMIYTFLYIKLEGRKVGICIRNFYTGKLLCVLMIFLSENVYELSYTLGNETSTRSPMEVQKDKKRCSYLLQLWKMTTFRFRAVF